MKDMVRAAYRWLAGCQVPLGGPVDPLWRPASMPIPACDDRSHPITTAARDTVRNVVEAAFVLKLQHPNGWARRAGDPPRPGYVEGVYDALRWAHYGPYISPRPTLSTPTAEAP